MIGFVQIQKDSQKNSSDIKLRAPSSTDQSWMKLQAHDTRNMVPTQKNAMRWEEKSHKCHSFLNMSLNSILWFWYVFQETVLTHRPGTHPGLDPSLQTLLENVMALESTEQISSWLCTERAWVNQSHGRALTCKSVQTRHCPCLLLPLPLAQNRVAWSYKGSAMCCMDLDLPQAEVEQRMASGIQDSKTQAAFPHS